MRLRPAAFALATLVGLPAWPAWADPSSPNAKADCSVDVIHARTDGDGKIDGQLAGLAEDLKKAPFTNWKTFKLLDKSTASLAEGGSAPFNTPTGGRGSLTYTGHAHRGGKHAIKLTIEVPGEKSNTRSNVTLDEGGHILVAGIKHQGGILIYAVSCKTEQ